MYFYKLCFIGTLRFTSYSAVLQETRRTKHVKAQFNNLNLVHKPL